MLETFFDENYHKNSRIQKKKENEEKNNDGYSSFILSEEDEELWSDFSDNDDHIYSQQQQKNQKEFHLNPISLFSIILKIIHPSTFDYFLQKKSQFHKKGKRNSVSKQRNLLSSPLSLVSSTFCNKFPPSILNNPPHLTHPIFVQIGIDVISKYLHKNIKCCWFPNTPRTLNKLYNRQYYDNNQPKKQIFLLAIDAHKENGFYWIIDFHCKYNYKVSFVYPIKTEIYLLYTSQQCYDRKIEKIDLDDFETQILPRVIFFAWEEQF